MVFFIELVSVTYVFSRELVSVTYVFSIELVTDVWYVWCSLWR